MSVAKTHWDFQSEPLRKTLKRVSSFAVSGKNGHVHFQSKGPRLVLGATDLDKALLRFVSADSGFSGEDLDLFISVKNIVILDKWIASLQKQHGSNLVRVSVSEQGKLEFRMPYNSASALITFNPADEKKISLHKPWEMFPTEIGHAPDSFVAKPATLTALRTGLTPTDDILIGVTETGDILFSGAPGIELGLVRPVTTTVNNKPLGKHLAVWSDLMNGETK